MATMTRRIGRNCLMAALSAASLAILPAAKAQDFPQRPSGGLRPERGA
jgi:hypothetical protein